jgi:microsomal dipeptidase-like Zn-dependent dipeptidase
MNRREFISHATAIGMSLALRAFPFDLAFAASSRYSDSTVLNEILVADAHAHPDQFYETNPRISDRTSTLSSIVESRMALSVFAAVGDLAYLKQGRGAQTEDLSAKTQLERVRRLAAQGKIKLVLNGYDLPTTWGSSPPSALLAIEGGDPLEGKIDRLRDFYNLGVRLITLTHYRNNELGDAMKAYPGSTLGPANNGLTPAGRKIVDEMQNLGMVVDVAHAQTKTLVQVAEMSRKPIIDSHTCPCQSLDASQCGRTRTWKEMELIARTGGVICTWPLGRNREGVSRKTFTDWAQEILEMKQKIGMEHVALGTDGGGTLPDLIDGYRDVRDLGKLAVSMLDIGLSREDVTSYMGGNFIRVLRACLG